MIPSDTVVRVAKKMRIKRVVALKFAIFQNIIYATIKPRFIRFQPGPHRLEKKSFFFNVY